MSARIYAATHSGRVAKLVVVDSTVAIAEERIALEIFAEIAARCP